MRYTCNLYNIHKDNNYTLFVTDCKDLYSNYENIKFYSDAESGDEFDLKLVKSENGILNESKSNGFQQGDSTIQKNYQNVTKESDEYVHKVKGRPNTSKKVLEKLVIDVLESEIRESNKDLHEMKGMIVIKDT